MALIVSGITGGRMIDRLPVQLNDPRALFKRDKRRTMQDVYKGFILPEIDTFANSLGAKAINHAKKTHQFGNRTGALEDSMRWNIKAPSNDRRDIEITAGGLGRVQFSRRVGKRKTRSLGLTPTGRARFIPRRGSIVERAGAASGGTAVLLKSKRQGLRKGDVIHVNYAVSVERRGFSVLKNTASLYGRLAPRMWARFLKRSTSRL